MNVNLDVRAVFPDMSQAFDNVWNEGLSFKDVNLDVRAVFPDMSQASGNVWNEGLPFKDVNLDVRVVFLAMSNPLPKFGTKGCYSHSSQMELMKNF